MAAVVSPAPGQAPPPSPILVLFMYHMGDEGGEASVSREIEIGCIKTPLVKKVQSLCIGRLTLVLYGPLLISHSQRSQPRLV